MKIPGVFLSEKDFERKINELMKPKEVSSTKRVVEVKGFYSNTIDGALNALLKENYEALFIPSIVDMRIGASGDEAIWESWYCSLSIRATGKTRQGKAVVIYAHVPNYFSNAGSINKAKEEGLINGAGIIPDEEFQRLLDLKDNKNVFVVDYNKLKSSESGDIKLKDAIKHPQTIPFLGGRGRAEEYFERHKEVYGEEIGVWHCDDLYDKPVGRLLFVGYGYYGGLDGSSGLGDNGRFVGVRAEGATQK